MKKNNIKFFSQGFLVWLLIAVFGFVLGAFDDLILVKLIDNIAITITGIAMCIVVFIVSWLLLPNIIKTTSKNYWILGIMWFVITFLFECTEGIIIESATWQELLDAYNPFLTGNMWIFVMISVLIAPHIIAKKRKIIIEN